MLSDQLFSSPCLRRVEDRDCRANAWEWQQDQLQDWISTSAPRNAPLKPTALLTASLTCLSNPQPYSGLLRDNHLQFAQEVILRDVASDTVMRSEQNAGSKTRHTPIVLTTWLS